jgi:hypothetical protein
LPVIVTEVVELTLKVVTVNVAVLDPDGTVTVAGVLATAVLLLLRVTVAPPLGAGPDSVTVPVEEFPPVTEVGLSETDDNVGRVIVSVADLVTP